MTEEVEVVQVYALLAAGPPLTFMEVVQRLDGEPSAVRRCLMLLEELALLRRADGEALTVVRPETGMTLLLSRAQARGAAAARLGATAPAAQPISAREWQVLQLLAQGCTDEAAARSLGVSLRTVRRVTAELMEKLGAKSRFQAGLKAALIFADRNSARPVPSRRGHSRPLLRRHPAGATG